jgi:hypothetical protein
MFGFGSAFIWLMIRERQKVLDALRAQRTQQAQQDEQDQQDHG